MKRPFGISFPARVLVSLIALNAAAPAQVGELIVLQETGPRDKRANIVVIGDGYTAAEKEKFLAHARVAADSIVKSFPFSEYVNYFNIYGIFTASNQSGSTEPDEGIQRDTYYRSSYGTGAFQRLMTIDYAKAQSVINQWVPETDIQFAVVNSETYGGSGGPVAVAAHAFPEIIAHEVQHSFTHLGDEYGGQGDIIPYEAPNTTQASTRETAKWNYWIPDTTPIPTPNYHSSYQNTIGLFEGAAHMNKGWYRPKNGCRMGVNLVPFCEVCGEAILLSLYDRVSPLDSAFPASGTVAVPVNQAPPLRIKAKRPELHALTVSWSVDGALQTDQVGSSFTKVLAPGTHKVTAKVQDRTLMVRRDPKGLLTDSVSWQVTVSGTVALRPGSSEVQADPKLLRADGTGFWVRLPGGASGRVRLTSADGSLAEEKRIQAGFTGTYGTSVSARFSWNHILAPGWYLAELEQGGRKSTRRFSVHP